MFSQITVITLFRRVNKRSGFSVNYEQFCATIVPNYADFRILVLCTQRLFYYAYAVVTIVKLITLLLLTGLMDIVNVTLTRFLC